MEYGLITGASSLQEVTFREDLFSRFIAYTDVKDTTLKGYGACLRQFMKWLQSEGITQPNRDSIKAYKAFLEGKTYTAGTKSQYLRAVKHFFKWTSSEGFYPNIADNIKGAKVRADNTKKDPLREEDVRRILDSIDTTTEAGARNYTMFLIAVIGGLRIIELQRANIEDVKTIAGQKVLFIQGKGHDEKDDYTKLVKEEAEALDFYLSFRPKAKKGEPLFTGTSNRARGKRITEPSLSRIIKDILKAAGYDSDRITAHSLRHTSNTLLFKSGADLFTVQQHARHSDPKTTEIYIHALDKEKDQSEQAIYNQIFKPKEDGLEKQIASQLEGMSVEDQKKVLNYIYSLKANAEGVAI